MQYSNEVQEMICVAKGAKHDPAPIPEEGKWVASKEIKDISGLTHGIGWCAPQQGTCKLTLNVKDGVIEEALEEVGFEIVGKYDYDSYDVPKDTSEKVVYAAKKIN